MTKNKNKKIFAIGEINGDKNFVVTTDREKIDARPEGCIKSITPSARQFSKTDVKTVYLIHSFTGALLFEVDAASFNVAYFWQPKTEA